MKNTNAQWFVLTAKPAKDELAEKNLLNQGYKVYRPLAKRLRKRRNKMVEIVESLFPRYLFIHLNKETDNWSPIRSTRGVASFVRFGLYPTPVPDPIIQLLKAQEEGLSEKAIDLDRFKKGESVKITSGSFTGLDAVFKSYDGMERAIVLIELIGKLTKLKVSPTELSKVA